MRKFISLIGFLVLVFVIGWVASLVTIPEVKQFAEPDQAWCHAHDISCGALIESDSWYIHLKKPSWQPPSWVFGPVWTILYIFIAISGWIVWRKLPTEKFRTKLTSLIMAPYWLQLALNFLWSIFFFGMHRPLLSLVDIVLLATTIGFNIGTFRKLSCAATYLLIPYLLWVCYAVSLNAAIVVLN